MFIKDLFKIGLLIAIMGVSVSIQAAPPQSMSYQAYLKDSAGLPVSATENITFRIYDAAGAGTLLWSDTLNVGIVDGLFNVELGTPGNPLPIASMGNPIWLGIEIGIDGEASPRTPLNSVNNAFRAADADMLQGQTAVSLDQSAHVSDTANPHGVTAAQTGAAIQADLATALQTIVSLQAANAALASRVSAIEANSVLALNGKLMLSGSTAQFSGVNVQIINGMNTTESTNTLGNLIVGYNQGSGGETRTGSHNIVVGNLHEFTSYGGLVAGFNNTISGFYASVSGGNGNTASGQYYSTVSGGFNNTASGNWSSVSGGGGNTADGNNASVSGGSSSTASGDFASVSGGGGSFATGLAASVSGGLGGGASGDYASISGGSGGAASGVHASISGGNSNVAAGSASSVTGGQGNQAVATDSAILGGTGNLVGAGTCSTSQVYCVADLMASQNIGALSTVSGGNRNHAKSVGTSVSGGMLNVAGGNAASVSGGYGNQATGSRSNVTGGSANIAEGTNSTVVGGGAGDLGFDAWFALSGDTPPYSAGDYFINNIARGTASVIIGGVGNLITATGSNSVVAGGTANVVLGTTDIIAGGYGNELDMGTSVIIGGAVIDSTTYFAASSLNPDVPPGPFQGVAGASVILGNNDHFNNGTYIGMRVDLPGGNGADALFSTAGCPGRGARGCTAAVAEVISPNAQFTQEVCDVTGIVGGTFADAACTVLNGITYLFDWL